MDTKRRIRFISAYSLLILLAAVLFASGLLLGSSSVTPSEALDVIIGRAENLSAEKIIMNIRLPRVCAAMLLGGALSVSGILLQTFFGNPIAGPFVLGISSGAKLAVAGIMIVSLQSGMALGSFHMITAAFVGSLLSMGAVMLISGRIKNMAQLIIGGVMIGYICSSLTELLVTFANDANIVNLHNWSMGSFSGVDRGDLRIIAVITAFGLSAAFLLSKPMGAYMLGEAYAKNSGVDIRLFRILLILLSSLLSACVTAFAGPVSFVGVAVPHLMKRLFGTARPLIMIPACFLGGGVFCMLCDIISRMLFAPTELSISTVTAVFGAPVVIAVMYDKRRRS